MNIQTENIDVKPFLRWAGGKSWLIKHLENLLTLDNINSYHEPFLGGGSVFFHLKPANAYLSDMNPKLIITYEAIKDDVEKVIDELRKFKNTKEEYYKVRSQEFKSDYKKSAQFIYLNQTSFNGIYRENLKGIYNVPYGFRTKNFFEPENLRKVNKVLQGATLKSGDFKILLDNISPNALVFLDPPYTVSHNRNGFIKYNKNLFSLNDQYRLKELIIEIENQNAYYILTNAAHEKINEIFSPKSNRLEVTRALLIGGHNAIRGHISEYIFTNIPQNGRLH